MEILSAWTNGDWRSVSPEIESHDKDELCSDGGEPLSHIDISSSDDNDRLTKFLENAILSEDLIALTGLGTSLCLNKKGQESIAPTMWDLWKAVEKALDTEKTKNNSSPSLKEVRKLVKYIEDPDGNGNDKNANIETLLSRAQSFLSFGEDTEKQSIETFVRISESIIATKCDFPGPEIALNTHVNFLRKIVRRPHDKKRVRLFTTNYDRCFEIAARQLRFAVIDGFSQHYPREFDGSYFDWDYARTSTVAGRSGVEFLPNVFKLLKLHGSIDWEENNGKIQQSFKAASKPVLVYPRESKFQLSFQHPYLELMSRFQTGLRGDETTLFVIGFGMNDEHIAEPIMNAIRSNISLRVVVVAPDLKDKDTIPQKANKYIKTIANLIRDNDNRLVLINGTFGDFVSLLPQVYPRSELELHRSRMMNFGTPRKSGEFHD